MMLVALLLAATAPASPANQVAEDLIEVPMDIGRYRSMSTQGRSAYLKVTVEALKWSSQYRSCDALTPDALATAITSAIEEIHPDANGSEPLLLPVAVAAVSLCSSSKRG